MLKAISIAATLAISVLFCGRVQAQAKVEIGTLTCVGGEGIGLIVGSTKTYRCKFSFNGGSRVERYEATITKIGVDLGVTGTTTIVWTVLAASEPRRAGVLGGGQGRFWLG